MKITSVETYLLDVPTQTKGNYRLPNQVGIRGVHCCSFGHG
ncbi:hypothetical protein HNR44_000644 [Geomicrobium halophilum]|uniref:Uncharacterized protein n=1 Tax=Geomicrobium halophilum TaxID=549000 RepID=A0A841PXH8_9BACL|nr:hypothetical protein [Geomicrobium halophilum]